MDDRTNGIYNLIQGMNDIHEAFAPDGYKLQRIWQNGQMAIDTKVDVNNLKDFVRYTNKKGTLGDVWNASEEWSQRREDKEGIDLVKLKANEEYKKKHHGIELESFRRKKLKDSLNNNPNCPLELD
ncbi:MAG: hypothetical protein Q7R95_06150 [bacterium]|nr:hypothetical protein [bacterium]